MDPITNKPIKVIFVPSVDKTKPGYESKLWASDYGKDQRLQEDSSFAGGLNALDKVKQRTARQSFPSMGEAKNVLGLPASFDEGSGSDSERDGDEAGSVVTAITAASCGNEVRDRSCYRGCRSWL